MVVAAEELLRLASEVYFPSALEAEETSHLGVTLVAVVVAAYFPPSVAAAAAAEVAEYFRPSEAAAAEAMEEAYSLSCSGPEAEAGAEAAGAAVAVTVFPSCSAGELTRDSAVDAADEIHSVVIADPAVGSRSSPGGGTISTTDGLTHGAAGTRGSTRAARIGPLSLAAATTADGAATMTTMIGDDEAGPILVWGASRGIEAEILPLGRVEGMLGSGGMPDTTGTTAEIDAAAVDPGEDHSSTTHSSVMEYAMGL